MKISKILAGTLTFSLLAGTLFAFDGAAIDEIYFKTRALDEIKISLEKSLADEGENAEILWRLARNKIAETDRVPAKNKDERLAGYSAAEAFADRALALKESPDALLWKASAMGRIGQVNGPLNSLGKAKPMRELLEKVQNKFGADSSQTWYVLALLYDKLPGGIISFGDKNFAISYMRRAIATQDARELNLRRYLELAEMLRERDLSAAKRQKLAKKLSGKFAGTTVATEKFAVFEGVFAGTDSAGTPKMPWTTKAFGEISDEQEAAAILNFALKIFAGTPEPLEIEKKAAEEIRRAVK